MKSLNEQLAVEPDFNSIIQSQKADLMERDAEIERLKAELELRTRERDQAIEFAGLTNEEALRIFKKAPEAQITFPELFARLAGRGE